MFKRGLVAFHGAVLALTVAVAVLVTAGSASADVSQTPVTTGCPAGDEHLTLDWLHTQGPYPLAGLVDAAGNNNGSLCGHPLSDARYDVVCAREGCHVPVLYIFRDDDSPALQS